MDETDRPVAAPPQRYLTVRQAAFIGVGAMVGAGIFALLGAAGEVAGAAVWRRPDGRRHDERCAGRELGIQELR
jgi:hypothetical protein